MQLISHGHGIGLPCIFPNAIWSHHTTLVIIGRTLSTSSSNRLFNIVTSYLASWVFAPHGQHFAPIDVVKSGLLFQ